MPHRRTRPAHRLLAAVSVLAALLALAACSEPPAEDAEQIAEGTRLTVFAPSTLGDALAELTPEIRRQTGLEPDFHYAPSATLARQIEAAANPDVVVLAEPLANKSNVRMKVETSHCVGDEQIGPTEVILREGELKQMLLNVVRNAIQASPPGGNVVIDFRYGQKAHNPLTHFNPFKWDSESWYGAGPALRVG